MKEPLPLEVTALAARQIRDAESWWRENRLAARDAVREELERALRSSPPSPELVVARTT